MVLFMAHLRPNLSCKTHLLDSRLNSTFCSEEKKLVYCFSLVFITHIEL